MSGEVEKVKEKTIIHWKLKEFSSLNNQMDTLCQSPVFHFCGQGWSLSLYPNGLKCTEFEGYIGLCLCLDYSDPPIKIAYSMGIRTAKGGTEVCVTGTKTFDHPCSSAWCRVIERSELLRRRKELLPQDVLTITLTLKLEDGSSETVHKNACVQATVDINVTDASVQAAVQTNVTDVSVQTAVEENIACGGKGESFERTGPDKIVEDVGKLWPNGNNTDVLLRVRDVEFKAHRTILTARIPVLGAMFHHDTTEKASGEVSIDDCEPEVFEQLLHFVYKGAPRELTAENASALFIVADKYLVNEVKALCVRCMLDTLCLDTFCDTLTLSLMYREEELLKKATDFLSKNMILVLKTVQWQSFMREHPTWANEIQIRSMELVDARYQVFVDRSV